MDAAMPTAAHENAIAKLRDAGGHPAEVEAFARRLAQLDDPAAGLLPGDVLTPLPEAPPALADLPEPPVDALDGVVVLKLNGGLGTSMGLTGPKSQLEVKPGQRFLDLVARQVLALRERHGARLPLVLMDSAATREPSLETLRAHAGLLDPVLEPDFLQGREPKLRDDTREPVSWPADPALEWCPPGHGDLYVALRASGMLDALLAEGFRYAFVSNVDNLGAVADPRIAAWLRAEAIPFAMEVVAGTAADRKGGHLALRDGRLVLRETAQVPDGDDSFGDVARWRWYNSNNLWLDLRALADGPAAGPELPLIVNHKTVDPTDEESPAVLQLESAMGAAIGAIDGARAVHVPRTRFAPVKTTDDLLVVRSDAYTLVDDGRLEPAYDGPGPVVTLDRKHYRKVPDLDARFPGGPPSLRAARTFTVRGDVTFGADVVVEGDMVVTGPARVGDGAVLRG